MKKELNILKKELYPKAITSGANERYNELKEKEFHYRSFYHGYLEGKFSLYGKIIEADNQLDRTISYLIRHRCNVINIMKYRVNGADEEDLLDADNTNITDKLEDPEDMANHNYDQAIVHTIDDILNKLRNES